MQIDIGDTWQINCSIMLTNWNITEEPGRIIKGIYKRLMHMLSRCWNNSEERNCSITRCKERNFKHIPSSSSWSNI
jgi:hypothetical protein